MSRHCKSYVLTVVSSGGIAQREPRTKLKQEGQRHRKSSLGILAICQACRKLGAYLPFPPPRPGRTARSNEASSFSPSQPPQDCTKPICSSYLSTVSLLGTRYCTSPRKENPFVPADSFKRYSQHVSILRINQGEFL